MEDQTRVPAEYVSRLMEKARHEPVAEFLGMSLVELTPGYARVTMKVKPEFLNFNGVIFGGVITCLADHAFSYASNSVALPSFACHIDIDFLSGAKVGDELVAECRVVKNGRRIGLSEMTVTGQDGKLIARATGITVPVR